MTTMQVFAFGDRKVRTSGTHDAPLFCAADVCAVLGYEKPKPCFRIAGRTSDKALQLPILVPLRLIAGGKS